MDEFYQASTVIVYASGAATALEMDHASSDAILSAPCLRFDVDVISSHPSRISESPCGSNEALLRLLSWFGRYKPASVFSLLLFFPTCTQ